MKMKAAVLHAAGDLRIEMVEAPTALAEDQVLVKVLAVGICGSDPGRVALGGTYRFPTIPGHEFSGVVESVGSSVSTFAPGDRVAVAPLMPCFACESCRRGNYSLCDRYDFMGSRSDGAFAQCIRVPVRNVLKLPDNVSMAAAATIEPAAVVLHGVHKIDLSLGDAVAVIGSGVLGFFAIQFAKLSGANPVIAVDVDEAKLALAREAGADITINGAKEDAVAAIRKATGGRGAQIVLETAGNNPGRETALAAVCKQGLVVVYGSAHHDVVFKPDLFEQILRREITLVGSWNSYSVPFPGKEWTDILELHRKGQLIVGPFISHTLELDDAPETFRKIVDRSFGPYNKILFAPNGVEALGAA